jgi:hypothetical protein
MEVFPFIERVVYINLNERTDRRAHIERELATVFPPEKVIRFAAISPLRILFEHFTVGCADCKAPLSASASAAAEPSSFAGRAARVRELRLISLDTTNDGIFIIFVEVLLPALSRGSAFNCFGHPATRNQTLNVSHEVSMFFRPA